MALKKISLIFVPPTSNNAVVRIVGAAIAPLNKFDPGRFALKLPTDDAASNMGKPLWLVSATFTNPKLVGVIDAV